VPKVGVAVLPPPWHMAQDMGRSRTCSRPKDWLRHYDVTNYDVMFQKLSNQNAVKCMTSPQVKSINRRLLYTQLMNSIAKNWAFTLNNYTQTNVDVLSNLFSEGHVRYLVFGREVSSTGTPHIQGYLQLEKKKRFKQVKSILPRGCHLDSEYQNSTPQNNRIYCMKDGDFEEFGTISKKSGNNPNFFRIILDDPNYHFVRF